MMTDGTTYFIRYRGRVSGPVSDADVRRMLERGQVTRLHEVSRDRLGWQRVKDVAELQPAPTESGNSTRMAVENLMELASMPEQVEQARPALHGGSPSGADTVPAGRTWYYEVDGRQVGPVKEALLQTMLQEGRIGTSTLVWHEGMTDWTEAAVTDLMPSSPVRPQVNRHTAPDPGEVVTGRPARDGFLIIGLFVLDVVLLIVAAALAQGEPGVEEDLRVAAANLLSTFVGSFLVAVFVRSGLQTVAKVKAGYWLAYRVSVIGSLAGFAGGFFVGAAAGAAGADVGAILLLSGIASLLVFAFTTSVLLRGDAAVSFGQGLLVVLYLIACFLAIIIGVAVIIVILSLAITI